MISLMCVKRILVLIKFENLRGSQIRIVDPSSSILPLKNLLYQYHILSHSSGSMICKSKRMVAQPIHTELNIGGIRAAIIGYHSHHMMPYAIEDIGGAHPVSTTAFRRIVLGIPLLFCTLNAILLPVS